MGVSGDNAIETDVTSAATTAANGDLRLAAASPRAEWPRPGIIQCFAHPICIVVAATVHVALGALMYAGGPEDFGENGTALETIAVDVVEALPSQATPSLLGTDGAAGVPERSNPRPARQHTQRDQHTKREETQPEAAEHVPSPEADQASQIAAIASHPRSPAELTAKSEPASEAASDAAPIVEQAAGEQEAAAQPSSAGSIDIVGEAAPGVVAAYGSELLRIVTRGAPKHRDVRHLSKTTLRGTVIVALVVTSEAQIEQLEIKQSSGNSQLDELALSAIRRLALPKPDPMMSRNQRYFGVPIVFR